jgi:hypothetical protein
MTSNTRLGPHPTSIPSIVNLGKLISPSFIPRNQRAVPAPSSPSLGRMNKRQYSLAAHQIACLMSTPFQLGRLETTM